MIIRADQQAAELTFHGTRKLVIARGGAIPNITQIAIAEFAPGDHIEPHQHPTMWEVYYVLAGKVRYREDGAETVIGPGDTVLVPPGAVHELVPLETPYRMLYWGVAEPGPAAEEAPAVTK